LFTATLTGSQETPPHNSTATGRATLLLSPDEKTARVSLTFAGLSSGQTDAHIHGPAAAGVSAPAIFPLPLGQVSDFAITLTAAQVQDLKNGLLYVNVHSSNFPTGEIRGQFGLSTSLSSIQFNATSYVVNEGGGSVNVIVTRSGDTSNAVTINYTTSNGSAVAPTDYTSASGSLQFAPGETVKQFVVPIVDDASVEHSETVNLILSGPGTGALEGSPFTSTISILDNDKPLILTDETSGRAAALDSVWMLRDPFPIGNSLNFSSDEHTRIMLFATGIELIPGETIVVQAQDSQNRIYSLVVEDVRKVPGLDWLSQIVVRLPDSIESEGDFQISITFRGTPGNKALISIVR